MSAKRERGASSGFARSAIVVWIFAASLGCAGSKDKPKAKPAVKKPAPGKLGAACKGDGALSQGTCAEGLLCGPLPGGYCAAPCPCGEGGACVDTPKMGELCAKTCASDAECRSGEGYVCDASWHVCVPGGLAFLAPTAPACEQPGTAPPKKTFGASQAISSDAGPGVYHTEVASTLTESGDLVAVYIANTPFSPNVLASSTVSAKGGVVGDNEVRFDKSASFDPWLATDRGGTLYLAYLGFDAGPAPEKNMTVGLATSETGQTWSTPAAAFDAATDCPGNMPGCVDKPIVIVGPDRADPKKDAVYVFYFAAKDEALKVVKSVDGGKSFSPSVRVASGAVADAEVTGSGKIHVVYVAGGGNRFGDTANRIEYVVSEDGGQTWKSPVMISGPDESIPIHFTSPRILADAKNAVLYAIYPGGTPDGRWNVMIAASRDGGVTWERAKVNDDDDCSNHMLPAAALDEKTGRVHVTWLENRTGTGAVGYTSCAASKKDVKCAPNETVNDTPFAAYSFVRHSTRWLGDYTSLVFDSKRRVLHAVWTQPVEEKGSPIARIFHASAKIK